MLKVGHHGSSTSSSAPFLDAVHPRLALVSVGAGNGYGHPVGPRSCTISLARGAAVLRTDQLGHHRGPDRWAIAALSRRGRPRLANRSTNDQRRPITRCSYRSRHRCGFGFQPLPSPVAARNFSPMVRHTATSVVTIERFIIEQEGRHPEATGELSGILYDLAVAAKMIANKVRSAGLADILGSAGTENVQGETQQKLDIIANEIIVKAMDHGGRLCAMASEEAKTSFRFPTRSSTATTSCSSIRSTDRPTST